MYWCEKCKHFLHDDKCSKCGQEATWITPVSNIIETIKVDKLFSRYSFELTFDSAESVSIMIAPNGYGKTTLFHFVRFLLDPSYESYLDILGVPFRRIVCIMKDGSEYGVAQGKCKPEDTSVEVQEILSSKDTHLLYWHKENNVVHKWSLDKILKDNLSLYKKELDIYRDELPNNCSDSVFILDELFSALNQKASKLSVKFIPADRLFASEERQKSIYSDLNLNNMNETISKQILQVKRKYELEYINKVNRYIYELAIKNRSKEYYDYYYDETTEEWIEIKDKLQEIWKEYSEKVNNYKKQNILTEYYKSLPYDGVLLDENMFEKIESDCSNIVLTEIVEILTCILDAMKPIDEFFERLDLLLKIINERLEVTEKVIILNNEGKLVVNTKGSRKSLPLSVLSSGEKNDLFLFYDLIFATEKTDIVLIDEPEISWHIEWQMTFIEKIQQIWKRNHFQTIIATHSPSIINGNIDLIAERVDKYYE